MYYSKTDIITGGNKLATLHMIKKKFTLSRSFITMKVVVVESTVWKFQVSLAG